MVDKKFPQETGVRTGREAGTTGSDHKPIPEEEGGTRDDRGRWVIYFSLSCHLNMRLYDCDPYRLAPAGEYQGEGGPEDKVKLQSENRPGDQDTLNLQDMKREGIAK